MRMTMFGISKVYDTETIGETVARSAEGTRSEPQPGTVSESQRTRTRRRRSAGGRVHMSSDMYGSM